MDVHARKGVAAISTIAIATMTENASFRALFIIYTSVFLVAIV